MWSGGKDSALALQRGTAGGLEISRLINFFDASTGRVRFHATRVDMIRAQAMATGIELRAIGTSWPAMEARLCAELAALREEGFAGVVLGDIHLAEVRKWYEDRVRAAGLNHEEPLWGESPSRLVRSSWRPAAAPSSPVLTWAVWMSLGLGGSSTSRSPMRSAPQGLIHAVRMVSTTPSPFAGGYSIAKLTGDRARDDLSLGLVSWTCCRSNCGGRLLVHGTRMRVVR